MILTVTGLLVLAAFIITIASAMGKAPLGIAVLLLVVHLISLVPIR